MPSKNMIIKIITIHGIPNFGSAFQAAALCRFLKKAGYSDVEVIDYRPRYFEPHTLRAIGGVLLNYFAVRRRDERYRSFVSRNIPLTSSSYFSLEELRAASFCADVYIAGGDQLWNVYHDCGNDDSYKLTFVKGKKISYGTSLGQSDFSDDQLNALASKIADFNAVSVRESSSVEMLAKHNVLAKHVVDPVFLLDPEEYLNDIVDPKEDPYMLVYMVSPSDLLESCISYLSNKYHLKVILCFGLSKKCTCDNHVKDAGPSEILGYLKNAEIVLSSSFHATAFSTIFKKQFFTILPDAHTNERILDYLTIRGLTHRIITDDCDLGLALDDVICYESLPDYDDMIKDSKAYLLSALEQ